MVQGKTAQHSTETRALNLRHIPMPTYIRLKVLAAAVDMGIRDYCVSILETHTRSQAKGEGESGSTITLTLASTEAAAGKAKKT